MLSSFAVVVVTFLCRSVPAVRKKIRFQMAAKGITVQDVPTAEFINAFAKHLKRSGKIELPKWNDVVKTASFKELAPYDPDWYYVRAASIARKIYLKSGTGVGRFKKVYGGSKGNGTKPSHFGTSSGAIARHILKQLELIKIVEKDAKGGRKITTTGQRDLDRIAGQVVKKASGAK